MNIFNINDYIVKNSAGEILRFYLDKNKRINYDLFDVNFKLVDKYLFSDDIVNDFSIDIDTKDRIHLIYSTNEGNVFYSLYSNEKWAKKALTRFDIRSNSYGALAIKINKENIHILYSFSNLINPNVWTIQHLIGTKGNWEKLNVISFTSGKNTPCFSFDFDKFDNMHMLYTSVIENTGHIYYIFFNASAKKWNSSPKQLSESQNSNSAPYILVDKIDNIHALWIVNKINSYEIKYKHMPQLGSCKNTWKEEILPTSIFEYSYPMIYEEKDYLKMYIVNRNRALSLASYDYGFSWNIDNTLSIPSEIKIQGSKYLTNHPGERNSQKTPHIIYILSDNKIILKEELMKHIHKCTDSGINSNKEINPEGNELIGALKNIDDNNFTSSNKEVNLEQLRNYFDSIMDKNLIIDTLSELSNNMKNIEDINKSFASQFKDMDNTILALKESIDINNQCLVEVQKNIEQLNGKNLHKGFFSRLFNRF